MTFKGDNELEIVLEAESKSANSGKGTFNAAESHILYENQHHDTS